MIYELLLLDHFWLHFHTLKVALKFRLSLYYKLLRTRKCCPTCSGVFASHLQACLKNLKKKSMVPLRTFNIHRTFLLHKRLFYSGKRVLSIIRMFLTLKKVQWKVLWEAQYGFSMASLQKFPFGIFIFRRTHLNLWNNKDFWMFLKQFSLCSPMQHLFDQTQSKNSNIVKYYYILK